MEDLVSNLQVARHLGGRKHAALIESRQLEVGSTQTYGLTARNADTGRVLWSRTYHEGTSFVLGTEIEPVGKEGLQGVVVLSFRFAATSAGNRKTSVTLQALDGMDGKQIWKRTASGVTSTAAVATHVPGVPQVFRGVKDGPPGYLIPSSTSSGTNDDTSAIRISGTNGHATPFGSTTSSTTNFPNEQVVPDLNGDGLDDVIVAIPGPGGETEALSGADATPLWTNTTYAPDGPEILGLGHFSHRQSPDLAIAPTGEGGVVDWTIIRGTTGKVLFDRDATGVYTLHTAGPTLGPAIEFYTTADNSTMTSEAESFSYVAVTPSDAEIYDHTISVSVPVAMNTTTIAGHFDNYELGDVQPDGSEEVAIDLLEYAVTDGQTATDHEEGVIDGRSGAFHTVAFQEAADGSLHKGSGTDLLSVRVTKGRPRLTATDGRSRTRLYRRIVPGIHRQSAAWTFGLRATGHSCSDIELDTGTAKGGELSLLTARGHRLWTVAFSNDQAVGGTLTPGSVPRHYCD